MKKYKLLKHIDNEQWEEMKVWTIFKLEWDVFQFNDWHTCPISFLLQEWYVEKVEEKEIKEIINLLRRHASIITSSDKINLHIYIDSIEKKIEELEEIETQYNDLNR